MRARRGAPRPRPSHPHAHDIQPYLRVDDVFRPRCRVLAFRAAPSEHHPVTPQECPCVATAGRQRRISLTCHFNTRSILPLRAGTLVAFHKVPSRVRHFPLAVRIHQNFLRLRRAGSVPICVTGDSSSEHLGSCAADDAIAACCQQLFCSARQEVFL